MPFAMVVITTNRPHSHYVGPNSVRSCTAKPPNLLQENLTLILIIKVTKKWCWHENIEATLNLCLIYQKTIDKNGIFLFLPPNSLFCVWREKSQVQFQLVNKSLCIFQKCVSCWKLWNIFCKNQRCAQMLNQRYFIQYTTNIKYSLKNLQKAAKPHLFHKARTPISN